MAAHSYHQRTRLLLSSSSSWSQKDNCAPGKSSGRKEEEGQREQSLLLSIFCLLIQGRLLARTLTSGHPYLQGWLGMCEFWFLASFLSRKGRNGLEKVLSGPSYFICHTILQMRKQRSERSSDLPLVIQLVSGDQVTKAYLSGQACDLNH